MSVYLAFDFGAESGRAVAVTLDNKKVTMETIHRFQNRPVRLAGTLYWDFPYLFAEMLQALKICAEKNIEIKSIGVDTWGVDFGLLGEDGQLLQLPVHYRDQRTENIHDYSNPIMTTEEIFEETSCEPWAISSLFQLLALQKNKSPILPLAKTFLNMPDLFNYFLTGLKASEKSIVSTSNLMSVEGTWSKEVISRFSLGDIFGELVEPGTVLGPIQQSIANKLGLGEIPVVSTCGHDTSAVVTSVPASGDKWAFLSCGTWSIVGKTCERPIATKEAFEKGFCNEYTLGSWFVCKNILGLWLVQELKRKWDTTSDPWDYDRMTTEAAQAEFEGIVDVTDDSLMAPVDMEQSLLDLLEKHGQPKPKSKGELIRCVLKSLALEYAYRLEVVGELTGQGSETLFMVGGGTANKLLCQLTADACGIEVQAGVEECTSLGNALTQAAAMGELSGPGEIREVMRNSFELKTYKPQNAKLWTEKLQQYRALQQKI